jgi:putative nucleotidyltransferase with HDIG domain
MGILNKNLSPRRKQLRETLAIERFAKLKEVVNSGLPTAVSILVAFIAICSFLFSYKTIAGRIICRPSHQILSVIIFVSVLSFAASVYVYRYNYRIIKNPLKILSLTGLLLTLLLLTKLSTLSTASQYLSVAAAVAGAIIMTIVYSQRFALAMGIFYSAMACLAAGFETDFGFFLTMAAGVITSSFMLREIRTRVKILEVGVFAGAVVFILSFSTDLFDSNFTRKIFADAGWTATAVICVSVVIQAFLPIIERVFHIATSMTLLDYSDANQPLLKKLAMDAPGTYSHSLLIGSIAETAADAIGANGLLCRVGSYYHDIGKIGKPRYFVENQISTASRHDLLSPIMSQLVIVGHVRDGLELAEEYGLPAVIKQFIETHHGTTLIEYFYEEAKKKANGTGIMPPESEFRYPGPRPQTKEAAIIMLADVVEGAVRSLTEVNPTKIETTVHNMAMKRLQDGQFDECELTLKELSRIEEALAKSLTAHYHGRVAYPSATPAKTSQPQQQSAAEEDEDEPENV